MVWCVPPTTRAAERTSNRHISLDTCDRAPQARANQLELSWDGEVAVVACYDTHARTAYIKHVLMQASHCRVGPNCFSREAAPLAAVAAPILAARRPVAFAVNGDRAGARVRGEKSSRGRRQAQHAIASDLS